MRQVARLAALVATLVFAACGDSPTRPPPPPPPPPPVPSATIQVTGNGNIIVHPSADPAFLAADEFEIRIEETAGGSAVWNFFRVTFFLNGVQIERSEQGADAINALGFRDIDARSNTEATVIIRRNAPRFDFAELLFGFIDKKDGSQFEQMLDVSSFDGVLFSPRPAVIPEGSTFAIVKKVDKD